MAYFVRIENPREFRRDVLESSKKVIGSLQTYRSVLSIRQKKKALMERLLTDLKEIAFLIDKLDNLLPEKQLRSDAMQRRKDEKQSRPAQTSKRAKSDDLDQALSKIQEKLMSLE